MCIRTCLGCRQRSDQTALVRVVAVTGQAIVDERRRLPGRGAWVHPDPSCVERADRSFARALRSGRLDTSPVAEWMTHKARKGPDREIDRHMDN